MKRTLIYELQNKLEEEVCLKGWVHRIRRLSKISFIILRDRTDIVQCVVDNKSYDLSLIKLESVVEIKGKTVESNSKISIVEIQVSSISVISAVCNDLPIEINKENLDINLETLLDHRVLSLRNRYINNIFKVQSVIAQAFREFLINNDFTEIFTPKIVSEGAEGRTAMFEVKYFEKKAYLAQSPQFYKQMLVGSGYERVFEISQVYRAEEHNSRRHLNEYVSMDLEMGFIEDERDIMKLENEILKYIVSKVREKAVGQYPEFLDKLPKVPNSIPDITFSTAIRILREIYGKEDISEEDLDPEGEKLLYEYSREKFKSEFLFVTDYPRKKRPMYTMPKGSEFTHSFDLLFRGMEITTGGQRIHHYDMLKENMEYKGLKPKKFQHYMEVFKFGMPPHGGLAIGLERLTCQLLELNNIREASFFSRDRTRLTP